MAASITDKFKKTRSSGRPVPAYLTATKTVGASTATINVATGWPTDTGIDFIIYRKDTAGNVVAGTVTTWTATLAGTTLSNLTLVAGTDMEYASGEQSVVMMVPTAEGFADLVEGLLVEHNQDGTHDNTKVAMLSGTQTFTGTKTFSTTPVVPDGSWTPAKLALTKTTDANGWTKYDYGTFQQYRKKGSISTTVNAGNWKYLALSSNLPVGMATIGTNFVEAAVTVSDAACSATLGAGSSETSIQVALSNQFSGGSITPTVSWSICITTP